MYLFVFCLISFLFHPAIAQGVLPKGMSKKVLIIQSYEEDNITSIPQERGIREALEKLSNNLEIETFYMRTKKEYRTPTAIRERGRLAREKIKEVQPDVIIVVDDNACKEVMLKMVDSGYKFVFTGMNMPPEVYNKNVRFMESRDLPKHNITGVFERLYFTASVRIVQEILPQLKKVILITSASPTGQAIKEAAMYELKNFPISIPLEIKIVRTLKECKALLDSLNKDYSSKEVAIIPLVDQCLSEEKILTLLETTEFILRHNHLPEVGGPLAIAKIGCLGGAMVDLEEMGKQAGEKAVLILQGRPPGEIPIEDTRGYKVVINFKRATELGIALPFNFLLSADVILGGR